MKRDFLRETNVRANISHKGALMNEPMGKKFPKCRVSAFDVYPDRNVVRRDDKTYSLEPRVMDVFYMLIKSSGDVVSRDTLIEKNWDLVHGADESLTRVISLLRKTLREAGDSEEYIETIPKRGYRLVQPVTWFHKDPILASDIPAETAPQINVPAQISFTNLLSGNETDPVSQNADSVGIVDINIPVMSKIKKPGMVLILSCAAIFALVLSALSNVLPINTDTVEQQDSVDLSPAQLIAQIDPASIAILPFTDLSSSGDQEYFSDGISEEILNVLARIEGLKVASRTSSFQFKDQKTLGITDIANNLRVRHVLEGSVRKAGDSVRITAQLIDAKSDQHLWSSTFDRTLSTENLFSIQDEIANAIVEAIRNRINVSIGETPQVNVKTGSVDAYESFLKARTLYQNRVSFDVANESLAQASVLDPDFAEVWALRATLHTIAFAYGPAFNKSPQNDRIQARIFARRALAIDPNNGLAVATLALANMMDLQEGRGNTTFSEVMAGFDQALDIESNSIDALNWRGLQMQRAGFLELGVKDHMRCVEVEQSASNCRYNLMSGLAILGRTEEALEHLFEALDYGAFGNDTMILLILAEIERRDLFLVAAGWHPHLRGWDRYGDLYVALRTPEKDHSELREKLAKIFKQNDAANISSDLFLASLGDEKAYTAGALYWFNTHSAFRQTTEFKDHIKKMGIYDYWLETEFPPQCNQVGSDDFHCA